jgi:hypothetical protein
MHAPTTQSLLAAWERGRAVPHRTARALALLGAAHAEASESALEQLSIGERDSLLLEMRQRIFGSQLAAVIECPRCGARLEMEFAIADISVTQEKAQAPADCASLLLRRGEYEVTFRLPNSLDLAAVHSSGATPPKQVLLERVVSLALCRNERIVPGELPGDVVEAMEKVMAEADPQAEIWLNLVCAACGRDWRALFDVASFLWSEVDAWAVRLLRDVHTLARAYAWREADILAMSPRRRQLYLEMLGT